MGLGSGRRIRVFLGEDNEADIFLVRQAFRQSAIDCDIEVARNGEDALSKLTNPTLSPPDLIVLDLNLPRVDGLSVLRALRQNPELSEVPVVIMTSSDIPRDREEALSLGARRFIHKPSHLDDFLAIGTIVKEILGIPDVAPAGQEPHQDPRHARVGDPGPQPVPVREPTPRPELALRAGLGPQALAAAPLQRSPTPIQAVQPPRPPPTPANAGMSEAPKIQPPTTMLSLLESQPPPRLPTGTSLRPARLRKRGSRPAASRSIALWAIPAGAAAMIALAGFLGHDAIEGTMLSGLKEDLQSRAIGTSQALRVWFELNSATARVIALRSDVQENVEALLALADTEGREALRGSAPAARLKAALAPAVATAAFEGFAVVTPTARVVFDSEAPESEIDLGASDAPILADVLKGSPRLFHVTPVSLGAESRAAAVSRHVFVAVPVVAKSRTIAALMFRLPLARDFLKITAPTRLGGTGEIQVFDRWGRLLTPSRFEDQLRRAGMLGPDESSVMRLEARDPGGDITKGYRPVMPREARPFTRAVANAIATGGAGTDIEGFHDYRGVEVVGGWNWLGDLDLGVVFKMDAHEALAASRYLRIAFWSVLASVLGGGLALAIGAALLRRLNGPNRTQQAGPYTLAEKIGAGAMGTVYRASHAMLRRPAAVKLLDASEPKSIQRFEREVQLTSQLSHPSTVAIYDYGRTEDGVFYYAMEHLEGIDLADLIHLVGPLPPARVVHILRQVCGSLAEAHAQGLVHRDIKPSNIMLTVRGGEADVVKVVDFGLARLIDTDAQTRLTKDGAIFGTPGFIPPEAFGDPSIFDARGDIYALGAVAYELLAGRPPFDRTSTEYLWHCHIEVVPPPPSVRLGSPLPGDLEAVVMKMLAKDPARRPQTAIELRALLDACTKCGTWTQAEASAWWTAMAPKLPRSATLQQPGQDPPSTTPFTVDDAP